MTCKIFFHDSLLSIFIIFFIQTLKLFIILDHLHQDKRTL